MSINPHKAMLTEVLASIATERPSSLKDAVINSYTIDRNWASASLISTVTECCLIIEAADDNEVAINVLEAVDALGLLRAQLIEAIWDSPDNKLDHIRVLSEVLNWTTTNGAHSLDIIGWLGIIGEELADMVEGNSKTAPLVKLLRNATTTASIDQMYTENDAAKDYLRSDTEYTLHSLLEEYITALESQLTHEPKRLG